MCSSSDHELPQQLTTVVRIHNKVMASGFPNRAKKSHPLLDDRAILEPLGVLIRGNTRGCSRVYPPSIYSSSWTCEGLQAWDEVEWSKNPKWQVLKCISNSKEHSTGTIVSLRNKHIMHKNSRTCIRVAAGVFDVQSTEGVCALGLWYICKRVSLVCWPFCYDPRAP